MAFDTLRLVNFPTQGHTATTINQVKKAKVLTVSIIPEKSRGFSIPVSCLLFLPSLCPHPTQFISVVPFSFLEIDHKRHLHYCIFVCSFVLFCLITSLGDPSERTPIDLLIQKWFQPSCLPSVEGWCITISKSIDFEKMSLY